MEVQQKFKYYYQKQVIPSIISALKNPQYSNVAIICCGEEKIYTSSLLLSFLSPWIGELLKECEVQGGDTELSLILPHVEVESINSFLSKLLDHEAEGKIDMETLRDIFPFMKTSDCTILLTTL